MSGWRLGILIGWVACLSSCFGIKGTKHTYVTGASAQVGGADVAMAFRPQGTRPGSVMLSAMVVGGGMATLDGPFDWRVVAIGQEGVQQSLTVHRIRTRTEKTGRDEWFPSNQLGGSTEFRPWESHPGKVRARYAIPGQLKVIPEEDGKLDLWVDMTVRSKQGASRKTVHFTLAPAVKDASQMVFLPTEIVESIGKDPEDWEDPLWD